MAKTGPDIYTQVTEAILAALEAGTPPWRCPWDRGGVSLPMRVTKEPYRGINVLLLWRAAQARAYEYAHWMTYRQAAALGGQVRRGAKSVRVVKYGTVRREEAVEGPEGDESRERRFGYLRSYAVFNVAEIEGLDEAWYAPPRALRDYGTGIDAQFLDWFGRTGIMLKTLEGRGAYYDIAGDHIAMPPVQRFESRARYEGTLLHEACHATGAVDRLDRKFGKKFGDRAYIQEEVVAELGAAFAGAQLGVAPNFEQNAAYLQGWIGVMKSDNRAILRAASAAQKAADWLIERAGLPDAAKVRPA